MCVWSVQWELARLGTWPGGMTQCPPPSFSGVPTGCVYGCQLLWEVPGRSRNRGRGLPHRGSRLSHAVGTLLSVAAVLSVYPEELVRWPSSVMGTPLTAVTVATVHWEHTLGSALLEP